MMPEMDGLEVLSELKHCEQTRDVPVLMLTARASEKDIRSAQDLGIDGYIVKPFDPVLLSKDIREKLRVKRFSGGLEHKIL
jgi:DNA-binding response OmpR family regulator